MDKINSSTHLVYGFYDHGYLLYIGCTSYRAFYQRLQDHSSQRAWWPKVTRIEILDTCSSRWDSFKRERELIVEKRPRYNRAGTKLANRDVVSVDVRKEMMAAFKSGASAASLARRFGITSVEAVDVLAAGLGMRPSVYRRRYGIE